MTRSKLAREIDVIIVTRWKTHAYGCGLAAAERINFSIAREILLPTNLRTLNQVNSRSPSFFLPILVTDRYYILIYSHIYIYTFFFLFTSRIHYTHKYTHIYIFAMTERIEIVGEKKRKKKEKKKKKGEKIKVFLASIRYETTSFHKRVTRVHFTRVLFLLQSERREKRFLLFDETYLPLFLHRERERERKRVRNSAGRSRGTES